MMYSYISMSAYSMRIAIMTTYGKYTIVLGHLRMVVT